MAHNQDLTPQHAVPLRTCDTATENKEPKRNQAKGLKRHFDKMSTDGGQAHEEMPNVAVTGKRRSKL